VIMEGSTTIAKPKSITEKKKGGFLFASVPEKTEEDFLQERNQKDQEQEQQEVTVEEEGIVGHSEAAETPSASQLSTSEHSRLISSLEAWKMASPYKVPLQGDRATASSLRERLRQYQALKAEQLNQPVPEPTAALRAVPNEPDDDANSFLGPATTASAVASRAVQNDEGVEATAANISEPPGK
jgi:hypothetical protein